jgi:ABC-2 type transport system permease protein
MSGVLLPAFSLFQREVIRFLRQRSRVLVAILTPLLFWLMLGTGIGTNFRPESAPPGASYLEFFFPGALVMVLLFTGIFSSISLIQDRQEGFLQGVLVSPVPRSAIVLGKVAGGSALAMIQAVLFLAAGVAAGVPVAPASLPLLLLGMTLIAFGLTGLGFAIAWRMDSIQGFHGVMNLILMPMWMLSGAFFPVPQQGGLLAWIMRLNPLTYGLAVSRSALGGSSAALPGQPEPGFSLAVAAGFAILTFLLSVAAVRGDSRR